ncbi:D-alanyl-D-alaninecarboxypeptidase/D-alanyl-D-al anine-endopeptidase [Emticicia oligotrophica DSM 17448]|uniref:D-alanyl-D-alaninecarboxypeptidase/D-alanyl-D-al anine-endopeptidase n=1 Tax=Emticicia oligotrophica (strain DSM 17448 / CIP 109782 / MTCC 6937 / GPTSA100-15) TaxID=929562 RepID=A0ABN4AR82_EMTOG|nr:D-alanyl-D-alanine carboxypeptidase/D-alanyl-D-alanine-endopeptidase [Emticicia oligotrophica]AFK04988.1 D-alanyl-D-alaninecarboxypeptidase/D-alanyl-D-al anine-endopeptidase [Emticicia oligotrophica DSM 17448]
MKVFLFILLQISSPIERLQKFIDSVQNDIEVRNGVVAASIRSTQTGEYKIQYNAHKSLNSASTLKLVSTASALSVLGSDYRFKTFLEFDGYIADSVLQGNIYIRGTGDPSFGSPRIGANVDDLASYFAQKIKSYGIKKVDGYILGDGSIFSENTLADSWVWGDIGNYYGAGINGLNVNENLYNVYFKQSRRVGDFAPISKISPEIPNLKNINKVTIAERGSGDNVMLYSTPFSSIVLSEGTIPAGDGDFSVKGAIPDPPTFFAYLVQKKFILNGGITAKNNISFNQYKTIDAYFPKQRNLIFAYDSPPISELVKDCNFHSINLYADAFFKTVGYSSTKDGSFDAAVKSVKQLWSQKGVDLQGFMIRDGSGLSPSGVLTANNLTDILYTMKSDSTFSSFYASIPIVGMNGTVQNLAKGSKAVGNVRAKSGSISNTRAFSGYFTASNGEIMSFTYIINRYTDGADRKVRRYLEEMIKLMVEI